MKRVIQFIMLISFASIVAFPALGQDGGKTPEPKQRAEIVIQKKSTSKDRNSEPNKDEQRNESGAKHHSRINQEKPQWESNR